MKKTSKGILSLILMLTLSLTMLLPSYAINTVKAETQASALKQLRLFKGVSATDFDLDRAPTRTEALIMLIRVLGQESDALNGNWSHPFTDVASWADKYVGYAYEKGLSKGISDTKFGTGSASSDMYLTFVLRALGYDDTAGDFAWNDPDTLAKSIGILPSSVDTDNFMRADVAIVSWAALEAKLKDGSQTLSQKLTDMRVFTSEEYDVSKLFVEKEGGTLVSTFAQLQAAAENKDVSVIQIGSDMEISSEYFLDREDGPETLIYIKEGVTLTVNGDFTAVGCFITNDGTVVINNTFDRGLCCLTNNGSVTVNSRGTFCSGMSSTYNYGTITVSDGGNLLIERGTQFDNYGNITNNGNISVSNGGTLNNDAGTMINNGILNLDSYFSGNISDITGSGTINDNR